MAHEFKNDILADSMNGLRRYRMINNDDGTISLEDVSEYSQTGTPITAAVMTDIWNGIDRINQNVIILSKDADTNKKIYDAKLNNVRKIVEEVLYVDTVSVNIPQLEPKEYKTVTMTFSSLNSIEASLGQLESIPLISVTSYSFANLLCYRNEVSMMQDGKTKLVTSWKNTSERQTSAVETSVKILYVRRNRSEE